MRRLAPLLFVLACLPGAAHAVTLPSVTSGTLYLHLDAAQGVSTNGTEVTQWVDQSANGFTFSQNPFFGSLRPVTLAANSPELVTRTNVDGASYSAIEFDGNDALTSSALLRLFDNGTDTLTVVLAIEATSHTGCTTNDSGLASRGTPYCG